jgi:hypothetical protein
MSGQQNTNRLAFITHHSSFIIHYSSFIIISLMLFLFSANFLLAQFPTQGPGGFGNPGGFGQQRPGQLQLDSVQEEIKRDTFGVYRFFVKNPFHETTYADTLITDYLYQHDPTRQRQWDYMHLGISGSAAQPIVYQPILRRGFHLGWHQYDLYLKTADDIPFYRHQTAFTNVGFNQVGDQNNSFFTAQFSRNFGKGFNASIDYQRNSQRGNTTLFTHQDLRNTTFGANFWFKGPKGRYNAYLTLVNNKLERQENGGLVNETLTLGGNLATPAQAEVFLEQGRSRYQHEELQFTQYFQLNRLGKKDTNNVDSLPLVAVKGKQVYQVAHSVSVQNIFSRYNDEETALLSTYYRNFNTDSRGVRNYVGHLKIENQFRLLTYRSQGPLVGRVRQESGLLELGLVHAYHRIELEARDSSLNEVFATGRWDLQPLPAVDLRLNAKLGLLGNIGDYQASGEINFKLGKLGQLNGKATNQLYSPTLIQREFWVTQQAVWRNDFKKTLESNLQAMLNIERFQVEVGAAYHLINNLIYFDTSGFARQSAKPVSILQLSLKKNFVLWRIHFDNQAILQNTSEDVLRLPQFFGKHSLYFEGKLFRVLNTRVGFDLRYQAAYQADYYMPLTGQFQLQDRRIVDFYPAADVFAAFQVTKFRAFFKLENLTRYIYPQSQLFYQTSFYPMPPSSGFRLGLRWLFVD